MDKQARTDQAFVPMGYVSGVHGVKGWVKVHSYTRPREAIFEYETWLIGATRRSFRVEEGRPQGKTLVARFADIDDRESARQLIGEEIAIHREDLPKIEDGGYYWADLIGLEVFHTDGMALGRVERMMETGANDVLVVRGERERLIPWIPGQTVLQVDLEQGRMEVDWDPEF